MDCQVEVYKISPPQTHTHTHIHAYETIGDNRVIWPNSTFNDVLKFDIFLLYRSAIYCFALNLSLFLVNFSYE